MNKKRGAGIVNYLHENASIFEYNHSFFIIQNGQQGVGPRKNTEQRASEYIKLYKKLPAKGNLSELGSVVLEALAAFDTEGPEFESWENTKLAKKIKQWLGARGQKDITVNSREIQIIRWLDKGNLLEIIPFDNFNRNPWCGPMEDKIISLPSDATAQEVGEAIHKAFIIATHHPDYIAPEA